MLKIRDLAIHVIPATMRPPEIGGGAYECEDNTAPCDPSGKPQCKPNSCQPSGRHGDPVGLSDDAVSQLKQQLRDRALHV